eukprot:2124280-Alexandrium_andersonii.AAC.1
MPSVLGRRAGPSRRTMPLPPTLVGGLLLRAVPRGVARHRPPPAQLGNLRRGMGPRTVGSW